MEATSSGRCVALIATKDEYYRVAFSTLLRAKLGFAKVIESASFDEAMESLSRISGVSLAVFDLDLPGIDKSADLRTVGATLPGLLIAVVSGAVSRRKILEALDAGVHGYIPKTTGVAELIRALKLVLIGNIYVPPLVADADAPEEKRIPELGHEWSSGLTTRQRDVLLLLVQGKSNKEIARELGLGEGTIKVHVAALFRAMGVRTRAAAAALGAKLFRK